MDRKKLYKLLGKTLEYTATFSLAVDHKAVLIDVKHKGKYLTDHVWVDYHRALYKMDDKTPVVFKATAESYIDAKGERKYGLKKCFDYRQVKDAEANEQYKHDRDNMKRRKSK